MHRVTTKNLRRAVTMTIGATLVLSSLLGNSSAIGQVQQYQQQQPTGGGQRGERAPLRRGQQPKEYQSKNMDREVSLPNVPNYTGEQKFISGMEYPNHENGAGYYMVMNTANTPEQVKEWWLNALRMHRWKVTFSDKSSIKAEETSSGTVSVQVAPPVTADEKRTKGMRGSYTIYYSPPIKKH